MSDYSDLIAAESSLAAWWRLGEASGNALDSEGSNHGVWTGTPTRQVAGAILGDADEGATFNGTTDYITVTDAAALDLLDTLSIEFWYKFTTPDEATSRWLISKGSNAYGIRYSGSGKTFSLRSGSSTVIVETNVQVANNSNWHHFVATKNGATVKLYLDGADVTGSVVNATLQNNSTNLRIGASQTPADFWNGSFDEIALYNTALSAQAVADHYAAATPNPISSEIFPSAPLGRRRGKRRLHSGVSTASFGKGAWPPSGWRPYSKDAVINRPIPASPAVHANSANIISTLNGWNTDPEAIRLGIVSTEDGSGDYDHPTYYANATDPLLTVAARTTAYDSDFFDNQIYIPALALPASGGDGHMNVVQPNGDEWSLWQVTRNEAGGELFTAENPLPASGGTIYCRGYGKASIHGTGLSIGTGDANAMRSGLLWGAIRYEELIGGVIPHGLFMFVRDTSNAYVYPATGLASSGAGVNGPADGQWFQLNKTDAEIDAFTDTWYNKVIYKAMAHYGLYVGDTTGSVTESWAIQVESARQYTSLGYTDRWRQFGARQNGDGAISYSGGDDIYYWNFPSITTNMLRTLDPPTP